MALVLAGTGVGAGAGVRIVLAAALWPLSSSRGGALQDVLPPASGPSCASARSARVRSRGVRFQRSVNGKGENQEEVILFIHSFERATSEPNS